MKQEWLTDGFEEADLLYTKYDPYAMQDEWTAKNGTFPGYNCRITAMSLFGDFLSVSANSQINAGEDVLFVDEETLKTDPDALGGSSLADFRALYSSMKAEDTTEIKRHVQTVQEEWASRGVTFRENEGTFIFPSGRDRKSRGQRGGGVIRSSTISRPRRNLCCLSGMSAYF